MTAAATKTTAKTTRNGVVTNEDSASEGGNVTEANKGSLTTPVVGGKRDEDVDMVKFAKERMPQGGPGTAIQCLQGFQTYGTAGHVTYRPGMLVLKDDQEKFFPSADAYLRRVENGFIGVPKPPSRRRRH